jgi:hypothetical protein
MGRDFQEMERVVGARSPGEWMSSGALPERTGHRQLEAVRRCAKVNYLHHINRDSFIET